MSEQTSQDYPQNGQTPPQYGSTPPPFGAAPLQQGTQPQYPPQYGQTSPHPYYPTQYGPAYPHTPSTSGKTNGFAIASLVLGIIWIYWIGSILALVFGYVARQQIRENNQSGDGMATAGIVLGWVGVGFLLLMIVLGLAGALD